ncbi:MAG TPA: hypothetical protein VG733_14650 [Chthoniobacteraceae bacterium]|nr:hypothetical protein [Chthoniobacteraceae bacterium]
MKTPREILLARHAEAADELDAIREKIVVGMAPAGKTALRAPATFIDFLLSLRWHAAGLCAAWLFILLLGRGDAGNGRSVIAAGDSPAPLNYFVELRKYRREFAELNQPPPHPPLQPVPHAFTLPRRREGEIDAIA